MQLQRTYLLSSSFAVLFLVVGGSGLAVWWNALATHDAINTLRAEHVVMDEAVTRVRSNVFRSAILGRESLLRGVDAPTGELVEQFRRLHEETEESLTLLDQSARADSSRKALLDLREAVQAHWDLAEQLFPIGGQNPDIFRPLQRLTLYREAVELQLGKAQDLLAENFLERQTAISSAERLSLMRYGLGMLFALLLSSGIFVLTLTRMIGLERASEATASELRRLSVQLRTAQEQERKSLARELHDQVGQMLTGLRLELGGIAAAAGSEEEVETRVSRAKGSVELLIGSIRSISMLLRPSMLDDLGLRAALKWLSRQISRDTNLVVNLDVDPAVDFLPDDQRTCLYRVVQEALTNVVRHAFASKVDVKISVLGDDLVATVKDDGKGCSALPSKERGLGLVGMEERVKALGGSIRFTSSLGHGVGVEVHLPRPLQLEEAGAKDIDSGRPRYRSGGVEASAGTNG